MESPAFCRVLFLLFLAQGALISPASAQQAGGRVSSAVSVNVRDAPAGSIIGNRPVGSFGTITAGPLTASLGTTSYIWWQVDWDTGTDGWSFSAGLTEIPPVNDGRLYGIDVSRWQSAVNWPGIAAAGRTFAFCKATDGASLVDVQFNANALNAPAAGVVLGMYHFARPNDNSALNEARHFASTILPWLTEGRLRPVLDLESGDNLGRTALSAWARTFCQEMERLTLVKPLIYVNRNYAANYLTAHLNVYPLWIAVPGFTPGAPVTGIGAWSQWTFQQYSWTGRFSAIGSGTVDTDLNCFPGTLQDLAPFRMPAIAQSLTAASVEPVAAPRGTTVSIHLSTHATHPRSVLTGATLFPAGSSSGGFSDPPREGPFLLASGPGSLTRPFLLPAAMSPGSYDLVTRLYLDVNANGLVDSSDWPLTEPFTKPHAIAVTTQPDFTTWAASHDFPDSQDHEAADPDQDGISNLMEYALGTLPLSPAHAPSLLLTSQPGGGILLTFSRPSGITDLTWVIETSRDLEAWAPLATVTGSIPFTGPGLEQTTTDPAEVRLTLPSTDAPRFLRLKVTRP